MPIIKELFNGEIREIEFEIQPQPQQIPQVVSARQMRLALLSLDLLTSVETAVAANPTTNISWEYATEFHRTNALVLSMQSALGKTDEEVDAIFTLAASL
jgi:hypothetical protein